MATSFPGLVIKKDVKTAHARTRRWVDDQIKRCDRADFSRQNLSHTDLRTLSFSARDLTGADLADADVHGTRFFGADLRRANLSRARGVSEEQFGGACLDGAVLPDGFTFQGLQDVRDLSGRAERTLLVLLVACVTTLVVAFVHEPVQLFRTASPVVIPGIGMQVPLAAFYVLTPVVLLGLHLSLVFTLRKLCYALSDLPVIFPNGRSIDQQVAPTSPNFAVLACPFSRFLDGSMDDTDRARKEAVRTPCRATATRAERWFAMLLIWWSVPLTLAVVWFSYLPRHELETTLLHGLCLALAVGVGIYSHGRTNERFRFRYPRIPVVDEAEKEIARLSDDWRWLKRQINRLRERVENAPSGGTGVSGRPHQPSALTLAVVPALLVGAAVTGVSALVGTGAFCSRTDASSAVARPLCHWRGASMEGASLDSLRLAGENLAGARVTGGSLRKTDLERANLVAAELSEATLRRANLKDAVLTGAVMQGTDLDSAKLREAMLDRTDLRGASLRFASLQGASFAGANLKGVVFDSAIVCGAQRGQGERWPSGFRAAYGAELAEPPLPSTRPVVPWGDTTPPPYLANKTGADEYPEWRRAWTAMARLRAYRPDDLVPPAELIQRVGAVDLSVARGTQAMQDHLLRALRDAPLVPGTGRIRYTHALARQLAVLRDTVRVKARRHCVDTDRFGGL